MAVFRHQWRGAQSGRVYTLWVYSAPGDLPFDFNDYTTIPPDALRVTKANAPGFDKAPVGVMGASKIEVEWNMNKLQGSEFDGLRAALYDPESEYPYDADDLATFNLKIGLVYALSFGVDYDVSSEYTGKKYYFIQSKTIKENYSLKEHVGTAECEDALYYMLSNYGTDSDADRANLESYFVNKATSCYTVQNIHEYSYPANGVTYTLYHVLPNGDTTNNSAGAQVALFYKLKDIRNALIEFFNSRLAYIIGAGSEYGFDLPKMQYYTKICTSENHSRGNFLDNDSDISTAAPLVLGRIMQLNADTTWSLVGGMLSGLDSNSIVAKAKTSLWDLVKDWAEAYCVKIVSGVPAPMFGATNNGYISINSKYLNIEFDSFRHEMKTVTANIVSASDEDVKKAEVIAPTNRNKDSYSVPEFTNSMIRACRYERNGSAHTRINRDGKARTDNIYFWNGGGIVSAHPECRQDVLKTYTTDGLQSFDYTISLDFSDTGDLLTTIVANQVACNQQLIMSKAMSAIFNSTIYTIKISDMPINIPFRRYDKDGVELTNGTFAFWENMANYYFRIDMSAIAPERESMTKYWVLLGDIDFNVKKETMSFKLMSIPTAFSFTGIG